jgi:hypothetical protein
MKRLCWFLATLVLVSASVHVQSDAGGRTNKITWKKIVLDKNFRAEGAGVADVNKDGKLDVIVGDCWYEAPKETGGEWKRHILRQYYDQKKKMSVPADRKWDLLVYTDSFCCFSDDFNGDGWVDVIVIPFPGRPCYWYENPGEKGGLWKEHFLTNSACNETPIFVDLFKSGKKHLVMGWNPPKNPDEPTKGNLEGMGEMCYFLPGKDPTKPWERISISGPSVKGKTVVGTNPFSHGLGAGDVNSDGRIDVICADGWWEQPMKADGTPWKFHGAKITNPCSDMYVLDIDGDGKNDIISSSAHYWGFWWSQQKDANSFVQRTLFTSPFDVAKLPSSLQLADEERRLFDAVNEVRKVQYSRSPFAAHPELCRMARDHAERIAKSNAKEENVSGKYPGKVLVVNTTRVQPPEDVKPGKKDKKDKKGPEMTPMQKLALSLMPNNEKDGDLLLPGFEIGVGAAKLASGEVQYTFVIGDRDQFSLPSQTHALHMVDINGDGMMDLVTGRRWWAHGPRGDDGANDPAQLYWFEGKKKDGLISFTPHLIDSESGVGTSFAIADMNRDGLPDIIVSNKKGVHVFLQQR